MDGSGRPLAIVGPDGQRTSLGLDAKDGLITKTTNPRGHEYHYTYDELGRLLSDMDPAGGGWSVSRAEEENGYTVTTTSGEGRVSTYHTETQSNGDSRRFNTTPDGTSIKSIKDTSGLTSFLPADGSTTTIHARR